MKLLLISIVLLQALADGLMERGYKQEKPLFKWLSKDIVEAGYIVLFFVFAYLSDKLGWKTDWCWMYLLGRLSFFNYINALAAGRDTLLGTTSLVDRIMSWITLRSLWLYILLTIVFFICLILF